MPKDNVNNEVEKVDKDSLDLLQKLTIQQQRFVHLYLTGQYKLVELAELLGVSANTVSKWLKRKDISAVIEEMQLQTHKIVSTQLSSLSLEALNKLGKLINSPIDGVAYQAVRDVLDRTGHKPKNEIKIDKTVTTIEEKFRQLVDSTIEVDYTEVDEIEEDGEEEETE